MKKLLFIAAIAFTTLTTKSQNIVTESNGNVTLRTDNDSIINQIEAIGSGAIKAVFNSDKTEIALIYNNGNVIVKNLEGIEIVQLAEDANDKAISVAWVANTITITTQSGKIAMKNSMEWRE